MMRVLVRQMVRRVPWMWGARQYDENPDAHRPKPKYQPHPRRKGRHSMIPVEMPILATPTRLSMPEIRTRMMSVMKKYEKIKLSAEFDWNVE